MLTVIGPRHTDRQSKDGMRRTELLSLFCCWNEKMSAARVGVLVADAITRWEFKLIILLNPIPEQYYVRFAQSFTRGLTIILMVIIILILQRIRKLISFPVKEGRGLLVGKCRLSPFDIYLCTCVFVGLRYGI